MPGFFLRGALSLGLLNIDQVVGLAVAGALLIYLAGRPERIVRALLVVLPFQLILTASIYALGLNGSAVRMLGLWKEVAGAALVVAAGKAIAAAPRPVDALDRLGIAYIGLGTAFLVGQPALVGDPGALVSLDGRFLSWRATVFPIVLLLAARHVRFSAAAVRRLARTALGLGSILGAIALVELAFSRWWNSLLINTIGVNRFRVGVLEVPATAIAGRIDDVRVYGIVGGRQIVRMGGPMVGQLEFSFLLLVLFAVALEHLVSGPASRRAPLTAVLVCCALVLTQTRSSILGALVVVVLVVRRRAGRSDEARRRLAIGAVVGVLLLLPFAVSAGLTDRFIGGDAMSDQSHVDSRDRAINLVLHDPVGRGLGMGTLGASSSESGAIVPENQLLDIGLQLGVVGMALFFALGGVLIVRLGRIAAPEGAPLGATAVALGMRSALLGLLVPCWFLQPFTTPEVGWLVFLLAGTVLGACERERAELEYAPSAADPFAEWGT